MSAHEKPVLIITGTSKGIGAALAKHYLDAGYRVVGCSRGEGSIEHPDYKHFSIDIGNENEVVSMVRSCVEEFGRIDGLLNNAGIASMNAALLTPGSTIESVFRTNCFGAFYCAREVAKQMIRRKQGRIVFFTTVARPMDLEGELAYASSKAAVESMTRILSKELAGEGVTVNAVGPTPVATDLISGVPGDRIKAVIDQQAIPRMGEFSDVANVVDFFLRPESNFVTGQVIYLGGVTG